MKLIDARAAIARNHVLAAFDGMLLTSVVDLAPMSLLPDVVR